MAASKEDLAEAVRRLSSEEQANYLAQALLREYMHRKGYARTLAKFDEENPRGELTISSRQLMHSLLVLEPSLAPRNKKRSKPFATIMEMLCSYRLRKRRIRGDVQRRSGPTEKSSDVASDYDSSEEEEELRQKAGLKKLAIAEAEKSIAAARASFEQRKEAAAAEKKLRIAAKKEEKEGSAKKTKSEKAAANGVSTPLHTKQMHTLHDAMSTVSSLPTGKDTARGASGSGHNWCPGGNISIPNVGLSSQGGPTAASDKPPSFLAGAGMSLMVNRIGADPHQVFSNGTSGNHSNGARGRPAAGLSCSPPRQDGDDDGGIPSPYRLGATPYDPNLKSKGVIRASVGAVTFSSSPSQGGARASSAPAFRSSASDPSASLGESSHVSSSIFQQQPLSMIRVSSTGPLTTQTNGAAPHSRKTISFIGAESNGQAANGSTVDGGVDAFSPNSDLRKSRRVKILDEIKK